jgi:hypothetical protein
LVPELRFLFLKLQFLVPELRFLVPELPFLVLELPFLVRELRFIVPKVRFLVRVSARNDQPSYSYDLPFYYFDFPFYFFDLPYYFFDLPFYFFDFLFHALYHPFQISNSITHSPPRPEAQTLSNPKCNPGSPPSHHFCSVPLLQLPGQAQTSKEGIEEEGPARITEKTLAHDLIVKNTFIAKSTHLIASTLSPKHHPKTDTPPSKHRSRNLHLTTQIATILNNKHISPPNKNYNLEYLKLLPLPETLQSLLHTPHHATQTPPQRNSRSND